MRHLGLILIILLSSLAWAATELRLGEVPRFDNSAIGFAGTASPYYQAFETELARGQEAKATFERILEEGTPAARLYAALGLYGLDRERGTAAMRTLASDDSPLQAMNGCLMSQTTVGKMATELLKNNGEGMEAYLP